MFAILVTFGLNDQFIKFELQICLNTTLLKLPPNL